jgi:competence protein ComEC
MGQGAAAFLSGILLLQELPQLPAAGWIAAAALLVPIASLVSFLRLPACCLAGFAWAALHAHLILTNELPRDLEGQDLFVEGEVIAIPERRAGVVSFEFDAVSMWRPDSGESVSVPGRIRLGWYRDAPELTAGERWRLLVRLKRPHGFANPGGFDYEGWLYRHRIRATGYVRPDSRNARLEAAPGAAPLQFFRQRLGARIAAAMFEREFAGVVVALAIGDYQWVTREQWEVFRRSGTTHLVAISGLHVSMVASIAFFIALRIWSRFGAAQLVPAPWIAAVAALACAGGYAALAGFSVPTQRAMIMVAAAMHAVLGSRAREPWNMFFLALWGVLVLDPLAVMDAGFWLSFGAVAIILLGMGHRHGRGTLWWRWGRLHMLIGIGLAPPLLALFQQLPLGSPLANFIAVPWVSLAVPVVLAGAVLILPFPDLGALLLQLAEGMLALLWPLLDAIADAPWLQWTRPAPAGWMFVAAAAGALLAIAPRGMPGRMAAIALLLPALSVSAPAPPPGALQLVVLDVGQGLSAVVRTREHVLIYDSGPRFSPDFDAGSAVVLPWLRQHSVRDVDMLLLSHGDNDHAGGAAALLEELRIARLMSSTRSAVPGHEAELCQRGMSWTWDGVVFEIIYPDRAGRGRRNDDSCVLRITAGGTVILLPGDIESRAENALLAAGEDVRADVIVAPHHGSRTSSSISFVDAVAPAEVVFSTGYRNRWGFPHPEVKARYDAVGARAWNTAAHGAVEMRISAEGGIETISAWREVRHRYWHEPAPERSGAN